MGASLIGRQLASPTLSLICGSYSPLLVPNAGPAWTQTLGPGNYPDGWGNYAGIQSADVDTTQGFSGTRSFTFRADGVAPFPRARINVARPLVKANALVYFTAWMKAAAGKTLSLSVKVFNSATAGSEIGGSGINTAVATGNWQQMISPTFSFASDAFWTPIPGLAGTPPVGTQAWVDSVLGIFATRVPNLSIIGTTET